MSGFHPVPGMQLALGPTVFEFVAYPLFPGDRETVFVVEGAEGLIYQIRDIQSAHLHALKVFKPSYRSRHIAAITQYLTRMAALPGLIFAYRFCITREQYPVLLSTFPELEYAILMPWIEAPSWAGLLCDQAASARYTREEARKLAQATAQLLASLEAHGVAHADIAGGNILLLPGEPRVQLLDCEGMYVPGMPAPPRLSYGSPGYQHRNPGPQGYWCLAGDRFAGAILLTEMLTWWEPTVRARVADYADTLFRPEELQGPGTALWQTVRNVLYALHPDLLRLFDQAWMSPSLTGCPDLATWAMTLLPKFY
ncbi:MAG TPA: hypothetical protein VL485_24250 [Ktedonobacteraceae bacterium]|nr:hypothetical protein [Ktedonobacteraceae bacterium]